MADFAARVADHIAPRVPVRQWVLTGPRPLRARMAVDPRLTSVVLAHMIAAISAWVRRRARRQGVVAPLKTGAVTVIQRFNSALELSVHFHCLVLDGVYSFPAGRAPVFHPLPTQHPGEVVITGRAGSVLLFNGHLLHSGRKNTSGVSRRAAQWTAVALET